MHRIFHIKAYEKEHGPHFNEEHARKAVMKMENEDGTRGPHWSIDETTALASQYGITLGSKFNRYDWFVALNMVYSDYYKVIINITGSNNTKNYVEFAKAWLNDKDIDEGKMWYYYVYVMCDKVREAEMEHYEKEMYKYEDDEEDEEFGRYRRGGRRMGMFGRRHMYDRDDYDRREHEYEHEHDHDYDPYEYKRKAIRYVQLKPGDNVYIIEVVGTFKKNTEYNIGRVISASKIYDEPLPQGQFPMPNQPRKKVIDIVIQCNGESKKFTIPEDRSVITDTSIGLTISTDKSEIVSIIRNQYNSYKAQKESIAKCDEEMRKCQTLLDKLGTEEDNKEESKIDALQKEIDELKKVIKQASQMVPPPMKQMLPQDMQDVMDKVDQ